MKKYVCLSVALALAFFLSKEIVKAEETHVKSSGSIETEIKLYSEDMEYLKQEIEKLLDECRR